MLMLMLIFGCLFMLVLVLMLIFYAPDDGRVGADVDVSAFR